MYSSIAVGCSRTWPSASTMRGRVAEIAGMGPSFGAESAPCHPRAFTLHLQWKSGYTGRNGALVANADRSPLRVIQGSTGDAGKNAVRGIVRHPDLELVGLHAHAKEKQGVDAAELCGLPRPTGVRATN